MPQRIVICSRFPSGLLLLAYLPGIFAIGWFCACFLPAKSLSPAIFPLRFWSESRECAHHATSVTLMEEGSTMNQQFRQGDVLMVAVRRWPKGSVHVQRENGQVILAHGEATGHAHAIREAGCELLDCHGQ